VGLLEASGEGEGDGEIDTSCVGDGDGRTDISCVGDALGEDWWSKRGGLDTQPDKQRIMVKSKASILLFFGITATTPKRT
jgi:hypothetical protein